MTKEEMTQLIYEKLMLRNEKHHCSGACGNCCLINDCVIDIIEENELLKTEGAN